MDAGEQLLLALVGVSVCCSGFLRSAGFAHERVFPFPFKGAVFRAELASAASEALLLVALALEGAEKKRSIELTLERVVSDGRPVIFLEERAAGLFDFGLERRACVSAEGGGVISSTSESPPSTSSSSEARIRRERELRFGCGSERRFECECD